MRRRVACATTPLPGSIVDLLLTGEYLDVHDVREQGRNELAYNGWAPLLDFREPEDLKRAWRAHRTWLLTEWRLRGGKGHTWAAQRFDQREDL